MIVEVRGHVKVTLMGKVKEKGQFKFVTIVRVTEVKSIPKKRSDQGRWKDCVTKSKKKHQS